MHPEDADRNRIVSVGACPSCGKDNMKTYGDGHQHCYSAGCGYHKKGDQDVHTVHGGGAESFSSLPGGDGEEGEAPGSRRSGGLLSPADGKWAACEPRKLTRETLRRYGYFFHSYKGHLAHIAPYHGQDGEVVAQKVKLPDKSFPLLKGEGYTALKDCKLFGQQTFGDKNDRRVVITEGEIDAMTVAQVMDFKLPCVSISAGAASAAESLKANYRWVDRFEEIILFFDNDEPGRKATEEAAKLFKVGKVKIARLADYKDANEALQASKPGVIVEAIYAAQSWRPRGIVNAADCFEDFEREEELAKWVYPWPQLNEALGGITEGQAILLVAGTGMGKSVILSELIIDLALRQGAKVGCMFFEATRKEAQEGLMTVVASKRVHLQELSIEEKRDIHKATFGSRKIELYDQETAERGLEAVMSYIRYLAKALDCEVVVVDPLSFVIAGVELSADERRVLDKASRDFADMAKELGITILITHHLSKPPGDGKSFEEGRHITLNNIRGSGGIAAFMSTVIGLEGNQQGPYPTLRRFRIAKARRSGKTGIADRLEFSFETGRYATTDRDYEQEEASENGGDEGRKPRFPDRTADADY